MYLEIKLKKLNKTAIKKQKTKKRAKALFFVKR
ncbi:hypothetical protein SRH_02815 [Mesomycoplasma hyorhinis MCLD]|uniref:Uncharacterized protein n=1 Tax=Mesomycoplasma hyorhinis (strain MCLD) TaxID=936139 RepID=A0ABM5M6M8_MESHM|nr:hypothetical protein SRH_02815 [Mesomycoplasma hyorhinis MCLD]